MIRQKNIIKSPDLAITDEMIIDTIIPSSAEEFLSLDEVNPHAITEQTEQESSESDSNTPESGTQIIISNNTFYSQSSHPSFSNSFLNNISESTNIIKNNLLSNPIFVIQLRRLGYMVDICGKFWMRAYIFTSMAHRVKAFIKRSLFYTYLFFPLLPTFWLSNCGESLTPVPKANRTHKPYKVYNSNGRHMYIPQKHLELNQDGVASYYGGKFHGRKTATGKQFNMYAYTAAHKTAHLPSVAVVTYQNNSRLVLINDRGPYAKSRILDCSKQLAQDLGFHRHGVGRITIKVLPKETLALKENGGHIDWDGSKAFPYATENTKPYIHHTPGATAKSINATRRSVVFTKKAALESVANGDTIRDFKEKISSTSGVLKKNRATSFNKSGVYKQNNYQKKFAVNESFEDHLKTINTRSLHSVTKTQKIKGGKKTDLAKTKISQNNKTMSQTYSQTASHKQQKSQKQKPTKTQNITRSIVQSNKNQRSAIYKVDSSIIAQNLKKNNSIKMNKKAQDKYKMSFKR